MIDYELKYLHAHNFLQLETPREGLKAAAKFLKSNPDFIFADIRIVWQSDGEYWETTLYYEDLTRRNG